MTDTKRSQDAVVIERSFDAPADLIWRMWTDPELFKEWFGPTGATIPVAKMDVRVGGSRLVRLEVQTPAGRRSMWFAGEYVQVVANQLLGLRDGRWRSTSSRQVWQQPAAYDAFFSGPDLSLTSFATR